MKILSGPMRLLLIAALAAGTGCAQMAMRGQKKQVVLKDFAEGRVVQVAITDRLTGAKEMLFVSMPKRSMFLEGYIQGVITDYEDNPIQGVEVRALAKGEAKFVKRGEAAFQTSSFDPAVSDANGIYRIRFSLPIIKNMVDIRGSLQYNPGWDQKLENLGQAYKPQMEQSPFWLYFDMKDGMIIFAEGVRKTIVKAVSTRTGGSKRALPGTEPAGAAQGEAAPAAEDDFMKGLSFGP